MPTVLTHALLPLAAAVALPRANLSRRLVIAGMVAAVLPDADLIGRLFAIPHTHDFGHRGATHTVAFALLLGTLAAIWSGSLFVRPRTAFLFVFFSALSHPLTDMLTDGGKGIMLFWPLDGTRFVWLVRPVEVSPILLRGFEDGRIWSVLLSEGLWLLAPALMIAVAARLIFMPRRSWRLTQRSVAHNAFWTAVPACSIPCPLPPPNMTSCGVLPCGLNFQNPD